MRIKSNTLAVIALAITMVLSAVPGVGVVQSVMAGGFLAIFTAWWRHVGRRDPSQSARGAWARAGLALLATAICLTFFVIFPLRALLWDDRFLQPEFYWLMSGGIWAFGVGLGVFRGTSLPGGTRQAVVLGLLTTAAWVPLGKICGLEHYLRFHPHAVQALGFGCFLIFAASARSSRAHAYRFFTFAFVQSVSLYLYWLLAYGGALGYIVSRPESVSPDGRIEVVARQEGKRLAVVAVDTRNGQESTITSFYREVSGLTSGWEDGEIVVTWYRARSNTSGGCEMSDRNIFWLDQRGRAVLKPCMESSEPLLCLQPGAPYGWVCERNVDCASQRCAGGRCDWALLGEACVTNASCREGTCIGRVCREADNVQCDDGADCQGYCYRDGAAIGQCYAGEAGDPCTTDDSQCKHYCFKRDGQSSGTCTAGKLGDPCTERWRHCESATFCTRDEGEEFPTCKPGPAYGVVF